MNCETIKTLAANAITVWKGAHNQPCELMIVNGKVTAHEPTADCKKYSGILLISVSDQNAGLTSTRWNHVSKILYNFYLKDLKCQEPQKL